MHHPHGQAMTRWLWSAVHNAIAHPLLVVLPARYGTALHDWTAARAWPENQDEGTP
jgi:hypothetical protein